MRFPGSKLLSQHLSTKTTPLDSIIRHCEDVNLSGYMEITFADAEALMLFYLGEQINVIYRSGFDIFVSSNAVLQIRNTAQLKEGKVSIYELPLDVAHMLRGLSNRHEIFGQIFAAEPLKDLIKNMEKEHHTGSLEVITNRGTGMILMVRGRFSNGYFETEGGVTFEKKEALNKIYELLERPDCSARVFRSEFSPEIWTARHEKRRARKSRLHDILEQQRKAAPAPAAAEELDIKEQHRQPKVTDRRPLHRKILSQIRQQTPSMLAAFFFGLETEEVELDLVEAPRQTQDRLIIEKLPAFMKYLETLAAMRNDDHIEVLSMTTENFYLIVQCIPETGEGLALITDKSQPMTLAQSLLLNSSHRYVGMVSGLHV